MTDIVRLLAMSSMKPILIAVLLFSPMAGLVIDWWLQSHAYRISLDLSLFIFSAFCIVAIALATISAQTFRAARSNLMKILKQE